MTKSILILGGTGLFGKPTAYQLKADGFQVRILARDVEKAQNIFTDGYEIMPGDVTDLARLEKAMTGCDGGTGYSGGKLDYGALKLLPMLFTKLIIRGAEGDYRNWDAIREWVEVIQPQLDKVQ